jgi:hypothetical protein
MDFHTPPSSRSPKPISAARLRAQRANAQRSTGPRTREGRRRSALNRLGSKPSELAWWGGLEPQGYKDFLRVRRDLFVAFWFVKPELWREQPMLELYLRGAAQAWCQKLLAARKGFVSDRPNASIHWHLSEFLAEVRVWNQKCNYWLRREFGSDGRPDIDRLREGIEARLSSFREWPRLVKRAKRGASLVEVPTDRTHSAIWLRKWDLARDFQSQWLEFSRNEPDSAKDRS